MDFMRAGLFPDDSVIRRVNRENVLLLGGGRALLMQLAHPMVAAGVDEHSDFRIRPMYRLRRTIRMVMAIVFGDRCAASVGSALRRAACGGTPSQARAASEAPCEPPETAPQESARAAGFVSTAATRALAPARALRSSRARIRSSAAGFTRTPQSAGRGPVPA